MTKRPEFPKLGIAQIPYEVSSRPRPVHDSHDGIGLCADVNRMTPRARQVGKTADSVRGNSNSSPCMVVPTAAAAADNDRVMEGGSEERKGESMI